MDWFVYDRDLCHETASKLSSLISELTDFHKIVDNLPETSVKQSFITVITIFLVMTFLRSHCRKVCCNHLNMTAMMILIISLINVIACYIGKKDVRGSKAPFINTEFSKAIMLRTKLRKMILNERTEVRFSI